MLLFGNRLMSFANPIFSLTSLHRSWSVADVMDWALFSGALEPAWRQFLRGDVARRSAESSSLTADDEALQQLSEAFRYDHDLITAEETERWLAARAVEMDPFVEHLERHYWRNNCNADLSANGAFVTAGHALKESFRVELWLTGEMDRLARALSHRALSLAQFPDPIVSAEDAASEKTDFFDRHKLQESEVAPWLGMLGRDPNWLQEQFCLGAAYRRSCAAALTNNARQSLLRAQRLSLLHIRLEVMRFDNLDAGREAALCVRESGGSVAQFAAECGQPFEEMSFLLGSASPEDQSRLLSLTPGELVGPEQKENEFQICRLVAKEEPTLENPEVAAVVDQLILESHFAGLGAGVVHWELAEALQA